MNAVREVALKVDFGRKSPCHRKESTLHQQHTRFGIYPTAHQQLVWFRHKKPLMASAEIGGAPQWQAMSQASWRQCCCGLPQLCRTHEQQCSSDVSGNVNEPRPTTSHLSSKLCLIVVAIIPTIIYMRMCILNGFSVLIQVSQSHHFWIRELHVTCCCVNPYRLLFRVVTCCSSFRLEHALSFPHPLPAATLQPGNITWHAFGLTHWGTPQKSCHFAVTRPVPAAVAWHPRLRRPWWRTSLMGDHLYFQSSFQNLPFIFLYKMNPLVIF